MVQGAGVTARVARRARSRYNMQLRTTRASMLTSAITAAVLTWLGIPPGPHIAGVWIAVKILLVALVALLGWRAARRRSHAAPPPTGGG